MELRAYYRWYDEPRWAEELPAWVLRGRETHIWGPAIGWLWTPRSELLATAEELTAGVNLQRVSLWAWLRRTGFRGALAVLSELLRVSWPMRLYDRLSRSEPRPPLPWRPVDPPAAAGPTYRRAAAAEHEDPWWVEEDQCPRQSAS